MMVLLLRFCSVVSFAFQLIQVLSAHSADMGVMNQENCTALHYAAATGNAGCCRFLAQRGDVALSHFCGNFS